MSNLRIFWIIWCSFWALGWLIIGLFTLLPLVMVPVSLLAILLPVGVESGWPALPPCLRCGRPAAMHADGHCPVRLEAGR